MGQFKTTSNNHERKTGVKPILHGLTVITLYCLAELIALIATISIYWVRGGTANVDQIFAYVEQNVGQMLLIISLFKILLLLPMLYIEIRINRLTDGSDRMKNFSREKIRNYTFIALSLLLLTVILNITVFADITAIVKTERIAANAQLGVLGTAILFFATVIVVGVVEEVIFRYILIDKLFSFLNKQVAAICAIILVFIITIFPSLAQPPFYIVYIAANFFPINLLASYMYLKEDNIMLNCLVHIIYSATSFGLIIILTLI